MPQTPIAYVLLPLNSDFIASLSFCQNFDLDVFDMPFLGGDMILFFDSIDFLIYIGWMGNRFPAYYSFL